jgi:hypothetical protein
MESMTSAPSQSEASTRGSVRRSSDTFGGKQCLGLSDEHCDAERDYRDGDWHCFGDPAGFILSAGTSMVVTATPPV